MKYELTTFETLIDKALGNLTCNNKEDVRFLEFKNDLDKETDRIRLSFLDVVFHLKKDKYAEKYIQQHQIALIKLFDKLLKYLPSEYLNLHGKRKAKDLTIPSYIHSKLEFLLNFIEKYFSKYFCQDTNIPNTYRLIEQKEFQKKLKNFERLKKCKLLAIALSPIYSFIEQNTPVSYKELIYLKELKKIIEDTCIKCKEQKIYCSLNKNLAYLNFNNYKFFTYLTSYITREYQREQTMPKQVEKLSYFLKNINQLHIKPGVSYKPGYRSIKDQIQTWIKEEIAFLEKNHQLTIEFPVEQTEKFGQTIKPTNNIKLETSLSVAQFAYLIRLFVDTGVFENVNHKDLINFFTNYFRTSNTDNISQESFRNKYYSIDENAKEFVRKKFIQMINETQKEYHEKP